MVAAMHARSSVAVRQRAELTFKHNRLHGRHGWLRLTPAYSVKVVEDILDAFGRDATRVFEPFSGTGTTPLCAAYRGLSAVSSDINPFLVWLGRVKIGSYTPRIARALADAAETIAADLARDPATRRGCSPPLKNIERWWDETELRFVTALCHDVSRRRGKLGDLLRIAFCRSMIALSNAAFNHQSMSFKGARGRALPPRDVWRRCVAQFRLDAGTVQESCLDNPEGAATVELSDSRAVNGHGRRAGSFDLLVTSPPYPNRMSYIRELRPYMYWLGYLEEAKQAGELDWEAIGGTWGIATSRLTAWTPTDAFVPKYLYTILAKIRRAPAKNGELMARYLHKYFDDMFHHFVAMRALMKRGSSVHYIVGNASFYGHLVPAERLYADQLERAGFKDAQATPIRKRNSKRELIEFHVRAKG
jgi:hypothetical protein